MTENEEKSVLHQNARAVTMACRAFAGGARNDGGGGTERLEIECTRCLAGRRSKCRRNEGCQRNESKLPCDRMQSLPRRVAEPIAGRTSNYEERRELP